MINTGVPIPIPPRGSPLTQVAKDLAVGGSVDVISARDAAYVSQVISGFKTKTGKKATQRKLVNEGENKTDVVAPGEVFWRVWRIV